MWIVMYDMEALKGFRKMKPSKIFSWSQEVTKHWAFGAALEKKNLINSYCHSSTAASDIRMLKGFKFLLQIK